MDFFEYIDEFRKYITIPASVKLEALEPSLRPAKRKMVQLIGQETYDLILAYYNTPTPADPILAASVEHVQATLANNMHIDYFKLIASERNATDNKLYKYQEDQTLEINITNVWVELDGLLELLAANDAKFPDYVNTDTYKSRDTLVFKDAREFDKYYGIDQSAYFHMRTMYLQHEIIKDKLVKRGVDITTLDQDEDYEYAVKKALAYEVMARAAKSFEYAELPKSIRNDLSDEMRRRVYKSPQETLIKEVLYQQFHNQSMEYLRDVEDYLQKQINGTYTEPEDVNNIDDKFFYTT